ncbi:MAG: DUF262 domain-containing protein [Muribaculaceae bacterium]|nr:DUF262 domain-containing protein [Muribaculaceae bacterium]
METFSFTDLVTGKALKGIKQIVIPKIQRDYAQGRSGQRATDVRNLFTANLIASLKAEDDNISMLDFIYGYRREGKFEPLDGQQRLTTLFLLHWLVLPEEKRSLLMNGNEPVVSYCTRPSARDFCRFLVKEPDPKTLISAEFDKAVSEAIAENKKLPNLSQFIRQLDEFRRSWEYDPTVLSMLNMLDALMVQFGTFAEIRKTDSEKLENIRFHIRDLDDLRQGDELYVKMNARGLELSDFDNTKSALEGDLLDSGFNTATQNQWRSMMDSDWIDFFWHRAGADNPDGKLGLEKIHTIEDNFKTLILRLVLLRWFRKYFRTNKTPVENEILQLADLEHSKRHNLSATFTTYLQLRFIDLHSQQPGNCPVIDYAGVITDFNSLIYSNNKTILGADTLLENLKSDPDSDYSFIDRMLENDFSHVNRLLLYGMLKFTENFNATAIATNNGLKKDWSTWMRILRNLALARNNNNRLDSNDDISNAMDGIDKFLTVYANAKKANPTYTMSDHVISSGGISGLDADNYAEEKQKELLRVNSGWANALDRFENEGYLFGQLRAPLQWAKGDIGRFKRYAIILNRLIKGDYYHKKLYAALLLLSGDVNMNYPYNNSLLTLNYDRDSSFKRYLREQTGGVYAPALKRLADIWREKFKDDITEEEFLDSVISDYVTDGRIAEWRRQMAQNPEMIEEHSNMRKIKVCDNPYLMQDKTEYSKLWNVNLCWLKKNRFTDPYFVLHHTKEENSVKDRITGGKLTVATGEKGLLYASECRRPQFRIIPKGLKRVKLQKFRRKA